MIHRRAIPGLLLSAPPLAALLADGHAARAQSARAQQELVDKAVEVIATMRRDHRFAASGDLLRRARAVMIVPELTRGGVIVGGQGGAGVLLARLPDGSWSDPAFFSIGGGTLGLQVGVQQAQLVFFILSEHALDAWLRDQVKFGGQDGIAVFMADQSRTQNALAQGRADVVTWAKAVGAYAGITVEGTSVSFNRDDTARYYGAPYSLRDVIQRGVARNPNASWLRAALGE
jgi:SH3 domain-containing YSC84-like protein 1